jgi:hypothetical protein
MAVDPQKLRINRNDLAKFLPDPRSVRQFEQLMNNFIDVAEAVIAANTAAATANAAADTALAVADTVTVDSAISNSSVTGLTVGANDAGASATITISAHTRVYGDGTSVAVNAGSVTGLAYSTSYWVIYNDPTRAGGAVVYTASTSVQGNGIPTGQHFVGAVTTPAAAAPPTTGNPVRPPGFAEP